MSTNLTNEIQLLLRAEFKHGIHAAPVIKQLEAESERPLPDAIPSQPQWVAFQWPKCGEISFVHYWRGREDRFWETANG